jgi:hypothetical protein
VLRRNSLRCVCLKPNCALAMCSAKEESECMVVMVFGEKRVAYKAAHNMASASATKGCRSVSFWAMV